MLCTNVAEVLAIAVASAAQAPLPLLPLQILYLNVLTDVFPGLALAVGEGDPSAMTRPPREPGESVLTREHWQRIAGWSTLMATCVLAALALALTWLELERESAVTVSFLTLALAKLWFVFNLREPESDWLDNDVVQNPWIWAALALCSVLLIAAVHLPGLSSVLKTRPPGAGGWSLALALSLVPFLAGQTIRLAQSWGRGGQR